MNKISAILFAALCAVVVTPVQAVAQRAFVASYGSDSNVSFGCDSIHPCRTFSIALTMVSPDGELIALDPAGYGVVTLTQSVSLTAAPGVYAGISVFPDAVGVTIATPGINVVLRGLTINSQGGNAGIVMTAGAKLSIENCVISNFSGTGHYGISVNSLTPVRMVNTLVRDNEVGTSLGGGAMAEISGSQFLGNNYGIWADNNASNITTAAVSDTIVSGGTYGIWASSTAGSSWLNISRSKITYNTYGISATTTAGTSSVTLSENVVAGNTNAFSQLGAGTIKSLGNNAIADNGSNTGTLTVVTLK